MAPRGTLEGGLARRGISVSKRCIEMVSEIKSRLGQRSFSAVVEQAVCELYYRLFPQPPVAAADPTAETPANGAEQPTNGRGADA